uniref:Uncharacterized protein n=1 Tax=Panagrolaimus sp. ES5 TaxID=591445 RepID=A0AC34FK12_9BILA
MSQGKILVEFKKANGGDIEVSEEKFLQSQMWFERMNMECEPQPVDGEVDNFNDEDNSYDEDEDKDRASPEKSPERESPERESSPKHFSDITKPFADITNRYSDEPPKTPLFIIQNTAKFKPFTPPTISAELRKEMVAKRNSDRKRKADDVVPVPSTPSASISIESIQITPEMRERSRRNREAALAKRKSLQSNHSFNSM